MPVVVLRGGSRDGESTTVEEGVRRLYAASQAPGLVDVYEATDEPARLAGNDETALVYRFVGQEPVSATAMPHLPMPPTPGPGHG